MKPIAQIVEELDSFEGSEVLHQDDEFMLFRIDYLGVLLSTVGGWDHLAVSVIGRTPTYQEMKLAKRLCFLASEWAYEVHPAVDDYISVHYNALHIWRPHDGVWRAPPVEVFMQPWATTTK
jgi:hypothetical protein